MHLTTLFFGRSPFLIYRHFIHLSIYMEESGPEKMKGIISPFIKSSLGSVLFLSVDSFNATKTDCTILHSTLELCVDGPHG